MLDDSVLDKTAFPNFYPSGVKGTEFIEGYADVLKSESCAKLLKLSDKVTLTRNTGPSGVPLCGADRYIRDIYRLAVQSVAQMGLQGGFTAL